MTRKQLRQVAIAFFSLAILLWVAGIISLIHSFIITGNVWWLVPIALVIYFIYDAASAIKEIRDRRPE